MSDPEAIAAAFVPFNGPVLIAGSATWLFTGCFAIQLYYYYAFHSRHDHWLKFVVAASAFAVALHTGFVTAVEWIDLVQRWGDPTVYGAHSSWESGLGPFTSALNGFIVQIFFISRILLVSKHIAARISAGVILVASLLAVAGSLAVLILFSLDGQNASELGRIQVGIRLWSISTVIADVTISTTMAIILRQAHSRSHFKHTKHLLTRLIYQSIETGSVTAVTMLLDLICFEAFNNGQNASYLVWNYISGPLYGNVLLFVLNSREHLRSLGSSAGNATSHSGGDINLNTISPSGGLSLNRTGIASVKVTTDVLTQYDTAKVISLLSESMKRLMRYKKNSDSEGRGYSPSEHVYSQ